MPYLLPDQLHETLLTLLRASGYRSTADVLAALPCTPGIACERDEQAHRNAGPGDVAASPDKPAAPADAPFMPLPWVCHCKGHPHTRGPDGIACERGRCDCATLPAPTSCCAMCRAGQHRGCLTPCADGHCCDGAECALAGPRPGDKVVGVVTPTTMNHDVYLAIQCQTERRERIATAVLAELMRCACKPDKLWQPLAQDIMNGAAEHVTRAADALIAALDTPVEGG